MKPFSQAEFKSLLLNRAQPCVSLYMPTHRGGQDGQQDPILFKNLYNQAREYLIAGGMRPPAAKEYLWPLELMLEDPGLWRQCTDGLALFRSRDMLRYYMFPSSFEPTVVAADRFHIKPLLPLLTKGELFYLLVLNLKGLKLYQCTFDSIAELHIGERVPLALENYLDIFELSQSAQHHTASAGRGAMAVGVMHAQNSVTDEALRKRYILDFFRHVDSAIARILNNTTTPMILAGVGYLDTLYRRANTYRGLLSQTIDGGTETADLRQLHRQAAGIIQGIGDRARDAALAKFRESRLVSNDPLRILPASYHGKVDTLLIPQGTHLWGQFDEGTEGIKLHDKQRHGEDDLLDLAAMYCLLHGGKTYIVGPEHSEIVPLGAIFRQ